MNIYENVATEAIASFFYNEPLWKKKILFDFFLDPFGLKTDDIRDVKTQEVLKGTIPDFTIITKNGHKFHFEVKINDTGLTASETEDKNRDAFLIRKNYYWLGEIPLPPEKILFWEDLFESIDKVGATKDFARLDLIREYMKEEVHTLLLTQYEVAMFYSPKTIKNVYTMSNKILELCNFFLDSHSDLYEYVVQHNQWGNNPEQDEYGIGYYFSEKSGEKRQFYIGISIGEDEEHYFSIALKNPDSATWGTDAEWKYFPLSREILVSCNTDKDLQDAFNKEAEKVLKNIDASIE